MAEPNNQVAVIQKSIELFKTAPQILETNQATVAKAVKIGQSILAQWAEVWNIEDEEERMAAAAAADERSNKFLANANTAVPTMKEARAAITQMMDHFKKMFTDAENQLDRNKDGTVTNMVQKNRDAYAREDADIKKRRREEADRIAKKAVERAEIVANYEENLRLDYNQYLLAEKQRYTDAFNKIDLDNYGLKSNALKAAKPRYTFAPVLDYRGSAFYHAPEETKEIIAEIAPPILKDLEANHAAEMSLLFSDLVDKLPSKLAELQEQKRLADEAEADRKRLLAEQAAAKSKAEKEAAAKRLKEQEEQAERDRLAAIKIQQDREAAETLRLAQEAEERQKADQAAIEMKKAEAATMALFDKEAAVADESNGPLTRGSYEITVQHQAGWVQIFQFWFENEGKTLAIDKIGNTKLDQMKAWCEKQAKEGNRIESKFLKYEGTIKSIAKKK